MKLKVFRYKEGSKRYKEYIFYKNREKLTPQQKMAFLTQKEISVVTYEETDEFINIYIDIMSIYIDNDNINHKTKRVEYIKLNKKIYGYVEISSTNDFVSLLRNLEERNPLYKKFDWLNKQEYASRITDIIIEINNTYSNSTLIYDILIGNIKGIRKLFKKISVITNTPNINKDKYISNYDFSYSRFIKCISLSSNPERDVDNIIKFCSNYYKGEYAYIRDLVEMSSKWGYLGTINFNWSLKRFREEHDYISIKIAELKMNHLVNNKVIYNDPLIEDDEFTILTTPVEFAHEASEMCHCLFSNDYFDSCLAKNTLILSFKDKDTGVRGTAEINFDRTQDNDNDNDLKIIYRISQFKGFRNSSMGLLEMGKLSTYLNDNTDWFNRNMVKIDDSLISFNCRDECANECEGSDMPEISWEDRERIERERVENIINSPNQYI